jgi:hypothetical protein
MKSAPFSFIWQPKNRFQPPLKTLAPIWHVEYVETQVEVLDHRQPAHRPGRDSVRWGDRIGCPPRPALSLSKGMQDAEHTDLTADEAGVMS